MLQTIPGDYLDGKIRLAELPPNVDKARVLVVFLDDPKPDEILFDDPGRDREPLDE